MKRLSHTTLARALGTAGIAMILVLSAGAGGASASPTTPSSAHPLQVGVPYTSTIDRRNNSTEWLKLPAAMHPGDSLTIATDSSYSSIRFCLVPAVDDFGQKDAEKGCDSPGYTSRWVDVDVEKGKFRRTLEWAAEAGTGYLLVVPGCGACSNRTWTYSLTLEQLTTRVNIGAPRLATATRTVALAASATLGDNTPAPDGVTGRLLWRAGEDDAFQPFAEAVTAGGQLALNGTLPPEAAGRTIELAACVDQIGGGEPRCTAQTVAIARDPLPTFAPAPIALSRTPALGIICPDFYGQAGCQGTITLRTQRTVRFRGRKRVVTLGRSDYSIPVGTSNVTVPISKKVLKLIRRQRGARSITVFVSVASRPGEFQTQKATFG